MHGYCTDPFEGCKVLHLTLKHMGLNCMVQLICGFSHKYLYYLLSLV